MSKKKSTEQFKEELEKLHPNKYTVLGEYTGNAEPIETLYNECGHVGFPLAHTLKKGCNCGICKGKVRRTHDMYVEDLNKKYPNKYTILGTYKDTKMSILVRYNDCGHEVETKAGYLLRGSGCPICNRGTVLTNEEFEQRFHEIAGDEYELLSEYKNTKSSVNILHKICNTEFSRVASVILSTKQCNCPKCNPNSAVNLVVGVNDIATTNPEMASLLKYPDDACKHTQHSKDEVWFICPDCGNEILKSCNAVATNGLCCPRCKGTYSYGERFVTNLLFELNVDFVYQYSPEWIRPYLYDFYFKHNGNEYIIEVDGGWHFEENNKSDITLDDVKERDKYKQDKAEEHGIQVIRLDYNYKSNENRSVHIINSIMASKMIKLFDMSKVDFEKIINDSSRSLVRIVADIWNSLEEKSAQKIMDKLNIHNDNRIRELLYLAHDLNLIKESKDEIKRINRAYGIKKYGANKSQKVMCNETGEVFNTMKEASQKYHGNIAGYFREENRKSAGQLPDGTRLTWTKLN